MSEALPANRYHAPRKVLATGETPIQLRQQILILHAASMDLSAGTVAWALFDGSSPDDRQMQTGDADKPPYATVLEAMRDGWRVIQLPPPEDPKSGEAPRYLGHEYVLERMVPPS